MGCFGSRVGVVAHGWDVVSHGWEVVAHWWDDGLVSGRLWLIVHG